MNKIILYTLLLVVIAVFGAIYTNTSNKNDENTYKIGMALALTGDASPWGEVSLNGAKLAIDEINSAGGINGKKVELVVEDTKSQASSGVLAVSKLQDVNDVNALIVTWLDVYHGPESALKKDIIMISPDAGVEAVNGEIVHPRVFSTWYRTEPKVDLVVKHMAKHGTKRLYVIVQNDSYYITAEKFIESSAKKYGVEIVGTDFINAGNDIKPVLSKISSKDADTVFFAFENDQQNIELLKRYKSFLGDYIKMYGDEFVAQNFRREDMKGLFEGVYFYAPENPSRGFYDSYKKRYGVEPIFGASTSYDAVYMIAKLLKDNPADIGTYMRTTKFETSSFGTATFDRLGGISSSNNYFIVKQVKNGSAVDAEQ